LVLRRHRHRERRDRSDQATSEGAGLTGPLVDHQMHKFSTVRPLLFMLVNNEHGTLSDGEKSKFIVWLREQIAEMKDQIDLINNGLIPDPSRWGYKNQWRQAEALYAVLRILSPQEEDWSKSPSRVEPSMFRQFVVAPQPSHASPKLELPLKLVTPLEAA
jgi:hypothetical protein